MFSMRHHSRSQRPCLTPSGLVEEAGCYLSASQPRNATYIAWRRAYNSDPVTSGKHCSITEPVPLQCNKGIEWRTHIVYTHTHTQTRARARIRDNDGRLCECVCVFSCVSVGLAVCACVSLYISGYVRVWVLVNTLLVYKIRWLIIDKCFFCCC